MIYQLKIYYGAILNGQAIYSLAVSLEDCKRFPEEINEENYENMIKMKIVEDGFNPDDFKIGYLTKEQYENRFSPKTEKVTTWNITKND